MMGQGPGPKGLGNLYYPRFFHYNNQLAAHAPGAGSFMPHVGGGMAGAPRPAGMGGGMGGGLGALRPIGGNFMGRGPGGGMGGMR